MIELNLGLFIIGVVIGFLAMTLFLNRQTMFDYGFYYYSVGKRQSVAIAKDGLSVDIINFHFFYY